MRILAATDFSTRSQRALRRAGLLARDTGAELTLVHVVDDDQPQDLIAMERREAGRILAEQVGAVAEFRGVQCHPMVATGDPFDAILRTAADLNSDLIVMGAHRKQFLRDVFIGTTIERVIRTGPHPVLMVNNEVQGGPYRTVLTPVDMSEPSANAIRIAQTLGLIDDARVTLVHAFHPFGSVGHPVLLFWDVMPAVLVGFERQEECPCMMKGTRPGLTLPEAAQAGDRCNKAEDCANYLANAGYALT